MKKEVSVKTTYYSRFLLLVVLPLLLAAVVGGGFLFRQVLRTAREAVASRQETVVSTLSSEVRQASLQLASFLLSDNGAVLDRLEQKPETTAQAKKTQQELERLFERYRVLIPGLDAMHFYMEDGSTIALYADPAVSKAEIKQSGWYKAAHENPKQICIGSAGADALIPSPEKLLLTAAIHPQKQEGAEVLLDTACLYFESAAVEIIDTYNCQQPESSMFLLENDTVLVGDPTLAETALAYWREPEKQHGRMDWCIRTPIRGSDLTVITLVDNDLLMRPYINGILICMGVAAAILLLYAIFSGLFLRDILRPLHRLSRGMEKLRQGDFSFRMEPEGHLELRQLMESYNTMSQQMESLIQQNRQQEAEKYQEELKALQNEINPHFLLNTVNTIRFIADMAHFDSIREMAQNLMEILSCVLRDQNRPHTLKDEVRMLEAYIRIMEIRYSSGFEFRQFISPESLECRLPRLLLQPLVENALKHGLNEEEDGIVQLTAFVENGLLHLEISDNGVGMSREKLENLKKSLHDTQEGNSIGLANVQRRIELQYGPEYGIQIESRPEEGTRFILVVPAQTEKGDANCSKQ